MVGYRRMHLTGFALLRSLAAAEALAVSWHRPNREEVEMVDKSPKTIATINFKGGVGKTIACSPQIPVCVQYLWYSG